MCLASSCRAGVGCAAQATEASADRSPVESESRAVVSPGGQKRLFLGCAGLLSGFADRLLHTGRLG